MNHEMVNVNWERLNALNYLPNGNEGSALSQDFGRIGSCSPDGLPRHPHQATDRVTIPAILDVDPLPAVVVLFQMAGGLYLGFAILNWMNRNAPMGGIYGKPVATANLVHFIVVALMLVKEVWNGIPGNGFLILCVLYTLFAAGFATTLFRDPFSGSVTRPPSLPETPLQ